MLHSDLFLGTSSGFAAMANFSEIPYFITKVERGSCKAYGIEPGTERLSFATQRQFLVYEPETRELLMRLLEQGLEGVPQRGRDSGAKLDGAIDVRSWEWERSQWLHPGATTSRYFFDDIYSDMETSLLVWPKLKEAKTAWRNGTKDRAWTILRRIETNFPRMCGKFPEFLKFRSKMAAERNERETQRRCEAGLARLAVEKREPTGIRWKLRRYLYWSLPLKMRLEHVWRRKHRIPWKLFRLVRRLALGRSG